MEKQNQEIDKGNKGGGEVAATGTKGGPGQLGGKGPTTRAKKRKRTSDKMQEVDHRPGDSGVTSFNHSIIQSFNLSIIQSINQ
jgi:hypothetical protein